MLPIYPMRTRLSLISSKPLAGATSFAPSATEGSAGFTASCSTAWGGPKRRGGLGLLISHGSADGSGFPFENNVECTATSRRARDADAPAVGHGYLPRYREP